MTLRSGWRRLTPEEAVTRIGAHDDDVMLEVPGLLRWLGNDLLDALKAGDLQGYWLDNNPHDAEHAVIRAGDLIKWMQRTGHGMQ